MAFIIRPDRHDTENKSIRFPVELIEKIEEDDDVTNVFHNMKDADE